MMWNYPLWEVILFFSSLSIIMASLCFLGFLLDISEFAMINRVKIMNFGNNKKVFTLIVVCAVGLSILTLCLFPHSSEMLAGINFMNVIATAFE